MPRMHVQLKRVAVFKPHVKFLLANAAYTIVWPQSCKSMAIRKLASVCHWT